ncbi:MAG TPA: PorV/PorQ family protein [candidate division Zixibacteria bacterium]|nr:PorV/PorQ family protein [candidate division Zixibacteria bacterium]
MKKKIILIIGALALMVAASAQAGNSDRSGTAGATELLIPVGARGSAMGGSVVANSYGVDAIYWNPAGLAWLEGTEATGSYLPYIADIDVSYVAIGKNIEDFGAIALSVKAVSIGDIEETTSSYPEGTGSVFNPTLVVIGATYARAMSTQVNFGFTANYIRDDIFEMSASGVSFDFGFTYEPRWRGITLGLAIKNYGPDIEFRGSGPEFVVDGKPVSSSNAKSQLPTSVNIGLAYNFVNQGMNSATFSGNFRSNNQSEDLWQGGLEYVYNERYALRAGYNFSSADEYLYGFSLGGGLVFDLGETSLSFDYSWTETEVFSDNQYFTLKASF